MLLVYSVSHVDFVRAVDLANWICELGVTPGRHTALVVASQTLEMHQIQAITQPLRTAGMANVTAIRLKWEDTRGWPFAPNTMFKTAVEHLQKTSYKDCFFWLEPDAIPLKEGWLDALEDEYRTCGKPYMGAVFDKPWPHMTGVGIYPHNVYQLNPHCLSAERLPFDTVRPDLVLPHVATTRLVQHVWGDIENNIAPTFLSHDELTKIDSRAVIFHRCKDGSLIARLRENSKTILHRSSNPKAKVLQRKIKALLGWTKTYYHSGNLGDIIYGLYAIKLHGGGHLTIGPQQLKTSPCSNPLNRSQYSMLQPLLRQQPYLNKIEYSDKYPQRCDFDLNNFRNHWHDIPLREEKQINTLCKMHAYTLGVLDSFREDEPWLTVPNPIYTNRIIIHRSSRYRASDFPWKDLVGKYRSRMLFVGTIDEWGTFQSDLKTTISFWKVADFLEMAQLISGGDAYIGNQSFGCAIAIACGQRVLQESWIPGNADCIFDREDFTNQQKGIDLFHSWMK